MANNALILTDNLIAVQDEGVGVGSASTLNFVGTGVTAAVSSGTATITITGGGGSGTPGGLDTQLQYNAAGTFAGISTATSDGTNLIFTSGARIRGDFSNATTTSRSLFQTSTTNGNTSIGLIPNGTSATSQVILFNNQDPTNASLLAMYTNGAFNTIINSSRNGTGTVLPLSLLTGGYESLRIPAPVGILANYLTVSGSTAGNYVSVGADGTDTNIGISIQSKGTSKVAMGPKGIDVTGSGNFNANTNANDNATVLTLQNGTGNSSTLWMVPRFSSGGYNPITQSGEFGFIFSGNPATSPGTPSGGFIVAPHSNTFSGLRMSGATGDVTFANKVGIGLPSITQTPAELFEVAAITVGARMALTDGQGVNRRALLLQGPPTIAGGYARIVAHDYQTGAGRDIMFNDVDGGSLIIGGSSLTTTATKGFLYLRTMPGIPTGVPTAYTGCMPLAINSNNNGLYGYTGSAWVLIGGSGGSGTPGGTNTQLQYNNGGTFGGITNVTSDGTNITFASGARIRGDFSNATMANRTMIQSSTTNGYSAVYAIPNGTATDAYLAVSNSATPENSCTTYIGSTATEGILKTTQVGSGTALPLRVYNGANAAFEVDTSGNVNFLGTSRRIRGDFSNATLVNRTTFQSSVTNGNTGVVFLPNGTSQLSQLLLYANSDPTNSPCLVLSATGTNSIISSTFAGTGAISPMLFQTGGRTHLSMPGYATPASIPNLVNYLTLSGSTTTNNVAVGVDGTDTNVGLTITPKGTGNVTVVSSSGWVIKTNSSSLGFSLMDRSSTPGRQFVFQGNDTTAASCVVNVAQAGGTTASPKTGAFSLWNVDVANSANATQLQVANNATYGPTIFTQAFGTGTNQPLSLQSVWAQSSTPKQMVLTTDGNVGINTAVPSGQLTVSKQGLTAALPTVTAAENVLHLGGADNNTARVTIDTFNNSTTSGSTISFRRTRGTNASNNGALLANDGIGFFGFVGNTGAAYSGTAAAISVIAAENWTATANGTAIALETTTNGTTTRTERLRVTSAGALSFGSSGTNVGTSGQVLTSQGSGAAPTWTTVSGGTGSPGGSDTQIQYNSSGTFAGNAAYWFDATNVTQYVGPSSSPFGLTNGRLVLTINSVTDTANTLLAGFAYGQSATINLARGNNTLASPTVVVNNDTLGRIVTAGYDGTSLVNNASINFTVDGTVSTGSVPSKIEFVTTTGTSANRKIQLTVDNGGNLVFNQTGQRIRGDLNNATPANRMMFQNSVTDGYSVVSVIPNGTSTVSGFQCYNSSDPSNASTLIAYCNGAVNQVIDSTKAGTGSYLPITISVAGQRHLELPYVAGTLVNYTSISGNQTGGNPTISASGTDTNVGLTFQPKGTGSITLAGSVIVSGTSRRITGDLTSATHASRVLFQTNTTNGDSYVGVIPNGTSTSTALIAYQSSNPDQSPMAAVGVNASGGYVAVARSGTAATLPLNFYTNNLIQLVLDTSGNLVFNQTGQRIRGDFSNATQSNRTLFQTSTTNGITNVGAIPNGTATAAVVSTFSSQDASNASVAQLAVDGTAGIAKVTSTKTGTGTYLPLGLYTSDVEQVRVNTNGIVDTKTLTHVKTAPTPSAGAVTLDVSTGSVFELTLTANLTSISFSNVPASGKATMLTVALKQDSTGGWTVTWPASVKWPNGATPTLVTTPSTTHIFQLLTYDGGTTYYGQNIGGGY